MFYEFNGHRPVVDPSAFVHPLAAVTGNVSIGKNVYIGPGASLRGDWGRIIIEDGCNVQESCTIHMFPGVTVLLKEGAHIGHGAIVHGAVIGRNCLIGMNSVIMDDVEIGDECIVGALTFIKAGEKILRRSVVAGNPAKVIREVSEEMLRWKTEGTALYQALPGKMRKSWRECEPERPAEAGDKRQKSNEDSEEGYRPWKETVEGQPNLVEEPAAAYGNKKFTIEEYLEMEEKSETKHEYYKGEIFAMSGPKLDHVRVVMNMAALLKGKLRGMGCEVFATDLRVIVESEEFLTYPDLSVVCGEPLTRNNDDWNLTNPVVIVEVLSKSTQGYDRDKKFDLYKALASLREYILVDSRSVLVEQFCKDAAGNWILTKYKKLTDRLMVKAVEVDLSLEEIYENVRFPRLSD
ncbi:MAG TPA: Uma2 family endonuclease [Puia sp.]|nr:Uma2 family endonuclease [Puia sp.]